LPGADRPVDCQTMSDDRWDAVDAAITGYLHPADPGLEAAVRDSASLPNIAVSPAQGQLLHLLARAIHASRILEIGTLGGYSAIWMGRALPDGGRLISLERDEHHAEVRVGAALDSLAKLQAEHVEPFDLVFIDADKRNTPAYFNAAVELAHLGSLIIVDNVVREGRLIDPAAEDPDTAGIRTLLAQMGADRRIVPAAIQTVGVKGWDGIAIALVVGS
jgi:predicted O-methyltransferase YrrM